MQSELMESTLTLGKDENGDWTPDTQQLAFEVWLHQAGRNLPAVATILLTEFDLDEAIPARTLRDWRNRYQWDVKAEQIMRLIAPAYREKTLGLVEVTAYQAMSYLARAIDGVEKVDIGRVRAAQVVLQAAGLSSYAKRDALPASLGTGEAGEEGTLDRSALLERERKRRSGE